VAKTPFSSEDPTYGDATDALSFWKEYTNTDRNISMINEWFSSSAFGLYIYGA
jgi:hypothetical protein